MADIGQGLRPTPQIEQDDDLVTGAAFFARVKSVWRPMVLAGLSGALIGLSIVLLSPTQYVSTVKVWVRDAPVSLDPGVERQRTITIDTEAQRAVSRSVLEQADVTIGDNVADIRITAPVNSTVLGIAVLADDPAVAQASAQRVGDAFLEVRKQYLVERRATAAAALEAESDELSAGLVAAPDDAAAVRWEDALTDVLAERSRVAASTTFPGRVISAASEATAAPKNTPVLPVSLFALFSLVALVILEFSRNRKEP